MLHHIHRLKSKPEHVRKNIAFVSAGALTALVALGWMAATVAGGTLALAPTPLDQGNAAALTNAASQTSSSFSQLLGAVGAATSATSSAPALHIVDSVPETAATPAAQKTVIPF